MALITAILLFLAGTLGTAFSRLVSDEFKAWIPWMIQRFIHRAITRLPAAQRERFEEEWQSHVNELPGDIGKLTAALGFLTAARKITLEAKAEDASHTVRRVHRFASALLLVWVAPLLLTIALVSLATTGRAFIATEEVANGRKFKRIQFSSSGRLGKYILQTKINSFLLLIPVLRGEIPFILERLWWERNAEGQWH